MSRQNLLLDFWARFRDDARVAVSGNIGNVSPWTARHLLGRLLAEGRELSGRSPEAVAAVTGVAGKTIRRLEEGASVPRPATVQALSAFYAFDPDFLTELTRAEPLPPDELLAMLRERAAGEFGPTVLDMAPHTDAEALWLAARLARAGARRPASTLPLVIGGGSASPDADLPADWLAVPVDAPGVREFLEAYLALDERRRVLLHDLARELHHAQLGESAD